MLRFLGPLNHHTIIENLLDFGYTGPIYPVNSKGGEIRGLTAYPSILDAPEPVDVAHIVIKNTYVPACIEDCVKKGVLKMIVNSAGFGEIGPEGAALKEQLVAVAAKRGICVFGPTATSPSWATAGTVGIVASEENDEPIVLKETRPGTKYSVLFDPLDESSNIDVNVQVAAGYVVYGSSTVLCYTTGAGVHLFTLDPEIGVFVLTRENIRMPDSRKMYSVNEVYIRPGPSQAWFLASGRTPGTKWLADGRQDGRCVYLSQQR